MFAFRSYKQIQKIRSSQISIEDLKRICVECIEVNVNAKIHEQAYFTEIYREHETDTEEQKKTKISELQNQIRLIGEHSLVVITIEGQGGERFTIVPTDDLDKAFSTLNIPHRISKIKLDNWSNYQLFVEKILQYRFTVELDFDDVPIWNFTNANNLNASQAEAYGLNQMWVLGAVEKIAKTVERRRTTASHIVHQYLKYELLLWTIGMPAIILGLNQWAPEPILKLPVGIQVITFLSIGLFLLTLFRMFYNYLRWLFPYLEIQEQPKRLQTLQRGFAVFVALGIASGWLGLIAEALIKKEI